MIVEGEKKGIWRYKKPVAASRPEEVKVEVKKEEVKVEVKKEEVKVEPKVEVKKEEPNVEVKKEEPAPVADLKPVASTQGLKVEPRPLFGQRRLKEAEFIYKEADDKSQKTWQFKKGTVVNVVQPGSEGWVRVVDSERRGGWIRVERMEEVK
jgi:hypothetical protein